MLVLKAKSVRDCDRLDTRFGAGCTAALPSGPELNVGKAVLTGFNAAMAQFVSNRCHTPSPVAGRSPTRLSTNSSTASPRTTWGVKALPLDSRQAARKMARIDAELIGWGFEDDPGDNQSPCSTTARSGRSPRRRFTFMGSRKTFTPATPGTAYEPAGGVGARRGEDRTCLGFQAICENARSRTA